MSRHHTTNHVGLDRPLLDELTADMKPAEIAEILETLRMPEPQRRRFPLGAEL